MQGKWSGEQKSTTEVVKLGKNNGEPKHQRMLHVTAFCTGV